MGWLRIGESVNRILSWSTQVNNITCFCWPHSEYILCSKTVLQNGYDVHTIVLVELVTVTLKDSWRKEHPLDDNYKIVLLISAGSTFPCYNSSAFLLST